MARFYFRFSSFFSPCFVLFFVIIVSSVYCCCCCVFVSVCLQDAGLAWTRFFISFLRIFLLFSRFSFPCLNDNSHLFIACFKSDGYRLPRYHQAAFKGEGGCDRVGMGGWREGEGVVVEKRNIREKKRGQIHTSETSSFSSSSRHRKAVRLVADGELA